MKKRSVIFVLVALILLFLASFAYVNALQCPPNSHTWEGSTETSDLVYCIPDVGPSGPVNPDQTSEPYDDEIQPADTGDYSDLSLDELYEKWDEEGCRWGRTDEEGQLICQKITEAINQKESEPSEEESTEEVPPEEETPEETPQEVPPEEEYNPKPEPSDSEALLDAVATYGMRKEEVRRYYEDKLNKALWEVNNLLKDAAKERFDKTPPLVVDVVNAKGDYQDALEKGEASEEELAKLKDDFDTKAEKLRNELNEILRYDPDSVDALWAMAVLNKWQGDDQVSYEYYRDALVSQFHRNVFKFNELLDSVRDPAMKMRLMRTLLPHEDIVDVPTVETSPFLKWYDEKSKEAAQQVDKQKRKIAEQIEKMAEALSLSKYLPEKLDELNK